MKYHPKFLQELNLFSNLLTLLYATQKNVFQFYKIRNAKWRSILLGYRDMNTDMKNQQLNQHSSFRLLKLACQKLMEGLILHGLVTSPGMNHLTGII